ncbi:hypothetical protein FQZ97_1122460 [compost metagenome]
MHTVFAQDPHGRAQAGTIDQAVDRSEFCCSEIERCLHFFFICDVGLYEKSRIARFAFQSLSCVSIQVCNDGITTVFNDHSHGSLAEAGGSAGDEEGIVFYLHFILVDVLRCFIDKW